MHQRVSVALVAQIVNVVLTVPNRLLFANQEIFTQNLLRQIGVILVQVVLEADDKERYIIIAWFVGSNQLKSLVDDGLSNLA